MTQILGEPLLSSGSVETEYSQDKVLNGRKSIVGRRSSRDQAVRGVLVEFLNGTKGIKQPQ